VQATWPNSASNAVAPLEFGELSRRFSDSNTTPRCLALGDEPDPSSYATFCAAAAHRTMVAETPQPATPGKRELTHWWRAIARDQSGTPPRQLNELQAILAEQLPVIPLTGAISFRRQPARRQSSSHTCCLIRSGTQKSYLCLKHQSDALLAMA